MPGQDDAPGAGGTLRQRGRFEGSLGDRKGPSRGTRKGSHRRAFRVPEPNSAVQAGGGEHTAVRAPGQHTGWPFMPLEEAKEISRRGPETNSLVRVGDG